ncbi:unnamed protein product [Calypogeia fissa]
MPGHSAARAGPGTQAGRAGQCRAAHRSPGRPPRRSTVPHTVVGPATVKGKDQRHAAIFGKGKCATDVTDGQSNGRSDRRTAGLVDGRTDGRTGGWMELCSIDS